MRKFIFTLLIATFSMLAHAQVQVFYEDFENPPGNVTSSGSPGWDINTRIQSNGLNSDTSTIDAPNSISYLETGPFDTQFQFFVTLTFDQICKVEFFDGGTVEYSIDGGLSWTQFQDGVNCIYQGQGLFGTQGNKFQEACYGTWQPGVIATPDNSWWKTEQFDISIVGNFPDVRLRFKLADGNNNGGNFRTGWAIDNIEVIASDCELTPPSMFNIPPIYSQTVYNLGPYTVNATANDASSIGSMTLYYTINSVAQTPIAMTNTVDSTYTATIPAVMANDTVCYYIEGVDASTCANTAYLPGPDPTFTYCFVAQEGISFPYCDNFDITTNLWSPNSGTGSTSGTIWELGTPAYGATNSAHTAPNAWDINLNSAYTNSATAVLLSPEFSFTVGAGATLEFWQNRNCEQGWDGVRLEWSPDTVNWNVLGTLQANCVDCENWYNDLQLNSSQLPAWTGNSNGWIKSKIILDTQFNNLPQCWFRFVFTSDGSVITDGFSIDDFCLSLPLPDDVGVTAITQPGITGPAGNCVDVIVTVKNHGLNTQTTFPVSYTVNGGPPVTATFNGNLTPGATAQFTLPCVTVPVGLYTICAYTSLPGDGNNFNDTTCITSTGIPVLSLTACDDFEGGNLGYQTTTTAPGAADWQLGTPAFGVTTGAYSGTNAWDINLAGPYGANATADLITPIYDLVGAVNPYISFRRNQNTAGDEGLNVYYNVNGSGNWVLLGTVGDPDGYNWYNNAAMSSGASGWTGSSSGWKESRYYLQNVINNTAATYIQFRFRFDSGFNLVPNDGVSIDDLCVKQPGPDDVGVTAIFEPFPNSPAGNSSPVSVQIRNFGTATQTTIPVAYSVNGGTPVTATYNGSLAPNSVTTFAMPNFTVPSGQFDFCAWTELPGDSDNSNDTTCTAPVGVPVILVDYTSPYVDDFDGTNVGWSTSVTGNVSSIWELGAPAFGGTSTAHSAPNAWDVNLNSGYTNNAECTLISPIFDLSNAVDTKLSFWRNNVCESGWDGTRLEYSVNGGNWTLLGGAGLTAPCWTNWYNSNPNINSSGQPAWMGTTGGWVKVEASCLGFLDNAGLVQFRFIFTSDGSVQQDGFSIDDFEVRIPVPLTAAPITVNTNTINNSFIFPGQSVQFSSPISNPGTTPLSSVIATLTIDGQVFQVDTIQYNPSLPSAQNLLHTFTQNWTAAPGVYDVCVITSEPNFSADLNPFDDTTCITISVFDSVTVTTANPYCTDFETGPQWVSVNAITYNSTLNSWDIGTPAQTIINGALSGQNAWMTNLTANYPNRDTSGLFTPVFSVDNTKCYKLSFWHKFDTEQFADGGTVEYSTDNAVTWQHLGFASSQPQPWFNSPFITALGGLPGLPGWSGVQSTWTLAEQEVNFFNSGPVIFRFRFATDNSTNNHEGWAIDDFCFEEITGPCTVGLNDPDGYNGLALGQNYPNPFNGTAETEFIIPEAGHVKVTVTDILGQVVAVPLDADRGVGRHKFMIDANKLDAGVYYYTLEFKNKQITRKMVVLE